MTTHIYTAGNVMDRFDPKVIVGAPIMEGELVEVIKTDVDPARRFVFVRDTVGNVQSVSRGSIERK